MTADQERILFAARRTVVNGTRHIILVDVKAGDRYPIPETNLLSGQDCILGDFLSVTEKLVKKPYLPSFVAGDVAFVDNVDAKLVNIEGTLLFQSAFFKEALCRQQLPVGEYKIKINLLANEHKLPSGALIHFEVTSARPFGDNITLRSTFTPIAPHHPLMPLPSYPPGASTSQSPTSAGGSINGSRSSTPAGKDPIIRGAGFQAKPKPKYYPKPNNNANKVVGTGFGPKQEENKEKKIVVGTGFAPPEKKKEQVIVGEGFEPKVQKQLKLRAVVLSISENQKTKQNTHFLWVLDRQAEGRFVSKEYKLLQGHFFEGNFTENKTGKWNCEKYEKQVEKPAGIDGGLDSDNKIWFATVVTKFQPAGANRRFGSAVAKYFGEVVEGELETAKLSADRNGKRVKIQRKGIAEKDYVWMVTELL